MDQQQKKQRVAQAALSFIEDDSIVGVGTGSTIDALIALLKDGPRIQGAVASSLRTEQQLQDAGIPVLDLNHVATLDLYLDGADEVDEHKRMIKGAGAALTREKVIATMASQFVCLIDDSKQVKFLGQRFPVPVEVLPMARSFVARRLAMMGANPDYREQVITDNGNVILDVGHLDLSDPKTMEHRINAIPGVLENGIFADRKADVVLCSDGIEVTPIR